MRCNRSRSSDNVSIRKFAHKFFNGQYQHWSILESPLPAKNTIAGVQRPIGLETFQCRSVVVAPPGRAFHFDTTGFTATSPDKIDLLPIWCRPIVQLSSAIGNILERTQLIQYNRFQQRPLLQPVEGLTDASGNSGNNTGVEKVEFWMRDFPDFRAGLPGGKPESDECCHKDVEIMLDSGP